MARARDKTESSNGQIAHMTLENPLPARQILVLPRSSLCPTGPLSLHIQVLAGKASFWRRFLRRGSASRTSRARWTSTLGRRPRLDATCATTVPDEYSSFLVGFRIQWVTGKPCLCPVAARGKRNRRGQGLSMVPRQNAE